MIGKDQPFTNQDEIRTRTDFKQHRTRFWDKPSYGEYETEIIQFMEQYKLEAGAWIDNPMFKFFYDWLKVSCNYYKDVLSINTDNSHDAKLRGQIAGQREILAVLEFMQKHKTKEAK